MDAFERVIEQILFHQGYWTKTSFKVNLTKEEKVAIGRPSSPRWEIDVVGYKADGNEILAVECKSYLDSPGVDINDLNPGGRYEKRYKLFNDATLRAVVLNRLTLQLVEKGMVASNPTVRLALAAGKVAKGAGQFPTAFAERGLMWFGPEWIVARLGELASKGYDNEVASVVAKLLLKRRRPA